MSVLHGESVVVFLGRKLKKTYQMSVLILHLEDLVLDGRRKLKTLALEVGSVVLEPVLPLLQHAQLVK